MPFANMVTMLGAMLTGVAVPPPPGTVKVTALLQVPFCWILTMPLDALDATLATTCVSLQLVTTPSVLPIQAAPLPCVAPKPFPVIVTAVPPAPELGLMLAICGKLIAKGTELLQTPFCRICAVPEAEPGATVATTWPSLQLVTTPAVFPSWTIPLP